MMSALFLSQYFAQNKDNMLQQFLDLFLPGMKLGPTNSTDLLIDLVLLFTSKQPSEVVKNWALNLLSTCNSNESRMKVSECDYGFVLDKTSGMCYIALNGSNIFWSASEKCSSLNAELVGFQNDIQVQGFLDLLNKGKQKFIFLEYKIKKKISIVCISYKNTTGFC